MLTARAVSGIVAGKGLSDKVEIKPWEGLIVHQAQAEDVSFLVRGLRAYGDFESEFSMALMNRRLSKSSEASEGKHIDTVFILASEKYVHCSSSLIREIARFGKTLPEFVPPELEKEVLARFEAINKASEA